MSRRGMVWSYAVWAVATLAAVGFLLHREGVCPTDVGLTGSGNGTAPHLGQGWDWALPGYRCAVRGGYVQQFPGREALGNRWLAIAALVAVPLLIPVAGRIWAHVRTSTDVRLSGSGFLWSAAALAAVLAVQVGYYVAEGNRFCGGGGYASFSWSPPAPRCTYADIDRVTGGIYPIEWATIGVIAALAVVGLALKIRRRRAVPDSPA